MVTHPLKSWLKRERRLLGWAARELKVSSTTLSRWFMGEREMGLEDRLAVEALTQGAVPRSAIDDWHVDHLKRLRKAA
jgi:DNA-binding transcriptional regulator YdaS (Cro superfamily)